MQTSFESRKRERKKKRENKKKRLAQGIAQRVRFFRGIPKESVISVIRKFRVIRVISRLRDSKTRPLEAQSPLLDGYSNRQARCLRSQAA